MIQEARDAVAAADALIITAGAGMGVDSGLPDFRGTEGFWREYPVVKKLGLRFEEMANPRWFEENPRLAWAFYGHRLHLYRDTVPHAGFAMLRESGERKPGGAFVVTSNVDGQFQKAGFKADHILEVHGSIHHLQCTKGCQNSIWSADGDAVVIDMETFKAVGELPTCPACGALARPNILMFGDWGWNSAREEAQQRNFDGWFASVVAKDWRIAVIEIGAGSHVPTIRHFSERVGQMPNATLIRINPREAFGPEGTISLDMGALEALREIL